MSRQRLHRIISEKVAISPGMAARLGRFYGNGPGLRLRIQTTTYRELLATMAPILADIPNPDGYSEPV